MQAFTTASFVQSWTTFFPNQPLLALPIFDGRTICYPTDAVVRDYPSWRQADTHINNQVCCCEGSDSSCRLERFWWPKAFVTCNIFPEQLCCLFSITHASGCWSSRRAWQQLRHTNTCRFAPCSDCTTTFYLSHTGLASAVTPVWQQSCSPVKSAAQHAAAKMTWAIVQLALFILLLPKSWGLLSLCGSQFENTLR